MAGPVKVLVACSDPESRRSLVNVLAQCGLEPVFSSTLSEARALLARSVFAMVFCAADLADGNFRDLLNANEVGGKKVPLVVASRSDDPRQYLEAMRLGAFDFITCPYRRSEVEWVVGNALRKRFAAA